MTFLPCFYHQSCHPPVLALAIYRALLLAVGLIVFSGCASDNTRSVTLSDLSQIKDGEVMVVGKMSKLPAVVAADLKQETDMFTPFSGERILLWLSGSAKSDGEPIGLLAKWGETFYFAVPRKTMRLTTLKRRSDEGDTFTYLSMPLPEPLIFLVRADDRAVYIGNIRLYVDEFDQIVALEVVDETSEMKTAFRQRFGASLLPRVSLIAPEYHFR
ncbi:hypothetical protein AL542_02505 [Grimontia hollisae]|uniref:hypothetical protein n=1 Tax=Grimontia hollisae TaxID=673 RepID=UPI000CD6AC98|nr:hypothetical protein [Grimontia hollisae]AMG29539.2 hypothetical protein AL542_02505 [Grimontia hollisae]STO77699.1 Uncharacterised protein [Grimontia hollisae]